MQPGAERVGAGLGVLAMLAVLAAALSGAPAHAGMMPMAEAVPDFACDGESLDYTPTLAGTALVLTARNNVRLGGPGVDGGVSAAGGAACVERSPSLRLGRRAADAMTGDFNRFFGSIGPITDAEPIESIAYALGAIEGREDADDLGFMLLSGGVHGKVALVYRKMGLYAPIIGTPAEVWIRDRDPTASLKDLEFGPDMQLASADDVTAEPNPLPATVLLLLGGWLPLLLSRRHRRR